MGWDVQVLKLKIQNDTVTVAYSTEGLHYIPHIYIK